MSLTSLVALCLFVIGASLLDRSAANANLQGKSGSLSVTIEDDDETNYNVQKLVVFFDSDCASTKEEVEVKYFLVLYVSWSLA